jgi:hypothetical protein
VLLDELQQHSILFRRPRTLNPGHFLLHNNHIRWDTGGFVLHAPKHLVLLVPCTQAGGSAYRDLEELKVDVCKAKEGSGAMAPRQESIIKESIIKESIIKESIIKARANAQRVAEQDRRADDLQ